MPYANQISNFLSNHWIELLTPAVQFLGIVCGACVVGWQLRRQHQHQNARQVAQSRDEMFLGIYGSFSEEIQSCQNKITEVSTTILTCPRRIRSYWRRKTEYGLENPTCIPDRGESLSELSFGLQMSIARVVSSIERYQIIFPNQRLFQAFRKVLVMQLPAQMNAFDVFLRDVRRFLPMDVPETEQATLGKTTIDGRRMDQEQYERISELAEGHLHECHQLSGCLIDLLHEAQNNLLGHLFEREIPPRIPRNEKYLSVRNDESVL